MNQDINSSNINALLLSQAFKACGDPLRLNILQVMKHDTFGVLELTQLFNTKQSGMSHHLKKLNQAGLIEAQREGNAIFYRRPLQFINESAKNIAEHIYELVDQCPLEEKLSLEIENIRTKRATQSQSFFAKNAEKMQVQQELIACHSLYAPASLQLLRDAILDSNKSDSTTVMEIGPGEGLLLDELSQTFDSVIAIDNSIDMLNKAIETNQNNAHDNITFIQADTQSYKQKQLSGEAIKVDAVIMNMVLHHVPSPSTVFSDISSFLNPEGVFIICDLSKHSQEWTKENCGDLWCGFDSDELKSWANQSGFINDKEAYIGLRNGFQIQLCSFKKPN